MLILILTSIGVFCRQKTKASFEPAKAYKKNYSVLYILNESDDKKIQGILRNIHNALNDLRLNDKLHIEVIAFADGVEMYKKSNERARCNLLIKRHFQYFLNFLKKIIKIFWKCVKNTHFCEV